MYTYFLFALVLFLVILLLLLFSIVSSNNLIEIIYRVSWIFIKA